MACVTLIAGATIDRARFSAPLVTDHGKAVIIAMIFSWVGRDGELELPAPQLGRFLADYVI